VLALGVLRMIAYSLKQCLRKRHVRAQHERVADTPLPWRELDELVMVLWMRIGVRLILRQERPTTSQHPIRAQTTGPVKLRRFDDNWPRTAHRRRGASKCQVHGVFAVKVGGRRAVRFKADRV
jgi:hypothetical protein